MTTLAFAYKNGFQQGQSANGDVSRSGASNKKSLSWLSKAAKAGFPIAQRELGELYILGTGVDFNSDTGLDWLARAAQSDYPVARLDLAQRLYETNPTAENWQTVWDAMVENSCFIFPPEFIHYKYQTDLGTCRKIN